MIACEKSRSPLVWIWIVLIVFLVAVQAAHAQPKISGKISGGFQAPTSTDDRGRRHVLKGETAEPRGGNLYEMTEPRVISYNADDTPEMFIEAPRCFYHTHQNLAYSDSSLSVRTADGRFAIEGVGWKWEPESADLVISNEVVALVQKSALATNLTGNAGGTNVPVRISSKRFLQAGEKASFEGDVVVQDGLDRLTCERLEIVFVKPEGLQTIEAIGKVVLVQKAATVHSGRAIYDLKRNEVRITEEPRWSSEQREGSAKMLVLNRLENTLVAEGEVFMKFPLTNVTSTAKGGAATNTFLEVNSDYFRFEEATSNRLASALYRGGVKVVHPEAAIASRELTVGFNETNRIQTIVAVDEVAVRSGENQAFGQRAEYDLTSEKISLKGSPHWKLEDSTGKSELLVFYPGTKEVLAIQNVEMVVPGRSVGTLFSVNVKTNQTVGTNAPMTIRSDTFSRGTNVAVFHGGVQVADARGKMSSDLVTIVSEGTNQVQRVIAEGGVRMEQPGLLATGKRAEYNVETGLVHLTGEPLLVSEGRTLRADSFVVDRNKNTFSVSPGKFRIEMPVDEAQRRRLNQRER
jgi:lipopolysaccharide transport protein LptA